MASELPQRHLHAARDGARTPSPRSSRTAGKREFEALAVDDPLLERVLEGLEGATAARRRSDARSA